MRRPKVLVTGGTGMVARNILEHPLAAKWDLRAPSRSELDLADYAATLTWMRREKPAAVIHAAGRVGGIQANIAHPTEYMVQNVDIGRNVILAAREAGVPRLLNIASSCMYPRDAQNPLTEDMILQGELEPTNEGYALAKIYATRLCQYIRRESPALQYKTLIPCNLYGRYDKFAPERAHLLPAIIHKLHAAKMTQTATVHVWGDGMARREFMYAGDFADAVLRALADIERLPELMNIGCGVDHTIDEFYSAVARVVGWNGRFEHDLSKPVGMRRKLVSIARQEEWGWHASTPLVKGIELTYRYYLEELRA